MSKLSFMLLAACWFCIALMFVALFAPTGRPGWSLVAGTQMLRVGHWLVCVLTVLLVAREWALQGTFWRKNVVLRHNAAVAAAGLLWCALYVVLLFLTAGRSAFPRSVSLVPGAWVIAAGVTCLVATDTLKRWELARAGRRCAECGYDLQGLGGNRCPECGVERGASE